MPRIPHPDPMKRCEKCLERLHRRRYNGVLEDMGHFLLRHYCNRACMAVAMEGRIKSPTAHNSRRQSAKAKKPQCERCGKAGKLHVHHKDENPLNNAPANFQTLCVSCHRLSHSPNASKTTGQRVACLHCFKPARQRGLCWTHLTRFKRYGDPLLRKIKHGSTWILSRMEE